MEYFLLKPDGEQMGTFSIEQVRTMLNTGFIDRDTRYWHEGATEWIPVDRIDESLQFEPPARAPVATVPPQKIAAVLKAVPPPSPKQEIPHATPVQVIKGEYHPIVLRPTVSIPLEAPAESVPKTDPEPVARVPAPIVAPPPRRRFVDWAFYLFQVAILALALNYAVPAFHYVSELFTRKITLAASENYVLLSLATIPSFADDMQNSPIAQSLQLQIERTTDPDILLRLKIGLVKERARHIDEVEQRYLQDGSAEIIPPGSYKLLDYLDAKGHLVTAGSGQIAWAVISDQNRTLYAYLASPPKEDPSTSN
jgi:hypothetical protein